MWFGFELKYNCEQDICKVWDYVHDIVNKQIMGHARLTGHKEFLILSITYVDQEKDHIIVNGVLRSAKGLLPTPKSGTVFNRRSLRTGLTFLLVWIFYHPIYVVSA